MRRFHFAPLTARESWRTQWRLARQLVRERGTRGLVDFVSPFVACSDEARRAILAREYPCDRLALKQQEALMRDMERLPW